MDNLRIGIIGLGLIGGSILKALADKDYELTAVSKSSYNEAKMYADVSSLYIEAIKDCDVVFVCAPMSKTNAILTKLETIVNEKTIVLDVCSLKEFVCSEKRPYHFIGSHPMAGTEKSGFENSFKELFIGAKWVLTENNNIIETIIKDMGAAPVVMEPKAHDAAAALISHMPTLLSFALFNMVLNNYCAKTMASSGFRDMTRLAMTNEILAEDMFKINEKNIDLALNSLEESLNYLKKLSSDERIKVLKDIASKRAELYDKNGKNRTVPSKN